MAALGKRFKPEQIVNLLREINVMTTNGKSLLELDLRHKRTTWRSRHMPKNPVRSITKSARKPVKSCGKYFA